MHCQWAVHGSKCAGLIHIFGHGIRLYRVSKKKRNDGLSRFSWLCSIQQLYFYIVLDRATYYHHLDSNIIKYGRELLILSVITYGLSFSASAWFPEFDWRQDNQLNCKLQKLYSTFQPSCMILVPLEWIKHFLNSIGRKTLLTRANSWKFDWSNIWGSNIKWQSPKMTVQKKKEITHKIKSSRTNLMFFVLF